MSVIQFAGTSRFRTKYLFPLDGHKSLQTQGYLLQGRHNKTLQKNNN